MAYDTFRELREHLDGQDPFMTTGHQIIKIRRQKKKIPQWVGDNQKTREFLLQSFPRMDTVTSQRQGAGRWARIINLYFQQHWSRGQIAEEMGLTYNAVNSLVRAIKRAAKGCSANGSGLSGRPKGRPRKSVPASEHLLGAPCGS